MFAKFSRYEFLHSRNDLGRKIESIAVKASKATL